MNLLAILNEMVCSPKGNTPLTEEEIQENNMWLHVRFRVE